MSPPGRTTAVVGPLAVLVILAVASCERPVDPIAPDARSGSTAPSSLELLPAKDIAALAIDVPVANRPWELTDAALMAGLEKSKGRAFIALKAPPSARVSETIRVELVRLDRVPIPSGYQGGNHER